MRCFNRRRSPLCFFNVAKTLKNEKFNQRQFNNKDEFKS